MKYEDEIREALSALADLLAEAGETTWATAFEGLRNEFEIDPEMVISKIHAIYGGMGSFNDIVLHKNGTPLYEENSLLSRYRKQLYVWIHE